MRFKACLY